MRILGINSATALASVCVVETATAREASTTLPNKRLTGRANKTEASESGKTIILHEQQWESKRDDAEKMLPAVIAALKKGKPDLIFVINGPGAFTGLRVGVTIANTLAYTFNVKIAALDTFKYLRARVAVGSNADGKSGEYRLTKTAVILKAGGEFVAALLPGMNTPARLRKTELGSFLNQNGLVSFAISDMSREEKKSLILPKNVKWLSEMELAGLPRVIDRIFTDTRGGRIHPQKMIVPKYLLPPKITKSKKQHPILVNIGCSS
jgi:hypothetical protein